MLATAVIALLVALAVVQRLNLAEFRRPVDGGEGEGARVSVLVPARDEERSIDACARSLAIQEHRFAQYEVIVLDDASSDRTPEIVTALAREFPSVRLIRGEPLPAGWRGKNWACHQLASAARGDYLVFCDADTTTDPRGLDRAVSEAARRSADLLSLMPAQRCETFVERVTIPLLHFFYLTFFPAFMLGRTDDPRFSAANGQFMLFRRDAYDAIGGHCAIRGSVVDDLSLARLVREHRLRLCVLDGAGTIECRMYRSGAEVVAGFSKNLYAALGGSAVRAICVATLLVALFVAPPVLAVAWRSKLWMLAAGAGLALRVTTALTARERWWGPLLHPLSVACAVALLFRSMFLTSGGREAAWKGRGAPQPEV